MAESAVKTAEVTPQVTGTAKPADALGARLSALDLPNGGFTAAARSDALSRLQQMGLPAPRDEYWRYTDPKPFNAAQPQPMAVDAAAGDSPLFTDLDRLNLVFVDGAFDAAASDDLSLEGVEIEILSAADTGSDHWAAGIYGALEASGQVPVKRPFAALNTVAARDGVLIRVTGKPSKPVHITHRRAADDADAIWHHVIRMEPGSEVTVLETGMSGARSNGLIEADVAQGAKLHYIASKRANHQTVGLSHLFARVHAEAQLKAFTLSVNGSVMRQEGVIEIVGDDAVAHIAAAVLGDGHVGPFHHDDTVFITHAAERCESRQVFKKVLKNGAKGVFQGKILVKPGAQKTDGYQISQALLLDEDSQFLAKPELEIYADDVICSHGSTTGAIDEEALFYLRSRGVPHDRAIIFLVLSFLADALEEVESDELRDQINGRLEAWLTDRSGK
ncbi:SufB/SufD family protein [Paracoccus fistulariae]|uniref:SufD family Fe-S cluster assembly protein n=1 Tax=Paracoccus fistulariae TaxID=658446 RepID=A0ABY7SK90_9RHOB|nr:SufD family Fe-S cluster assembly protein [Paracoccus fistulariae]MDB6181304.1 SufD family Fe-S cluster assembly protein [Paracoccus fistulariae]WCR07353.1 SufD family Fe-S cluster assembly protein [Paracoccus fistulariae]